MSLLVLLRSAIIQQPPRLDLEIHLDVFSGMWDLHKQTDHDQWDAYTSWLLWQAGTLLPMDISSVYSWNIQDCKLHGTEGPCQDHRAPRAGRREGANSSENTGMSSPKAVLPFH